MTPKTQRKWTDFLVFIGTAVLISLAGAEWWAIVILLPFSLWNYYDGMTRHELKD